MRTAQRRQTLRLTLLCATALGLFLPRGSAQAAEAPEPRLKMSAGASFEHDTDAVFGTGRSGSGFVQFESRVVGDYAVEIQLQTSTLTATFVPDYAAGTLTMTTNDGQLVASDWRAIRAADEALRTEPGVGFNPLAALYLSRSLSMLADSEPNFVWESRLVPLPKMLGDEASFYDVEAYRDSASDRAVSSLSRDVTFSDATEGLSTEVMARPPARDAGPVGPTTTGGGGSSGATDKPKCTSYITDKANGKISCDEHGNYYCVEYDYYPGTWVQGQDTMKTAAPSIPPSWSRSTAAKVPVYYSKVLNGAYPCSGRCGPGCKDGPWISGSKAGGWGMGCLIHDQCVYQSTGGEELDKLWEKPANIQSSPDCGQEMMAAGDDYFMPPEFCPGTKTVGGKGKWTRHAPPDSQHLIKRNNEVYSTRAKRAGKVKKPN